MIRLASCRSRGWLHDPVDIAVVFAAKSSRSWTDANLSVARRKLLAVANQLPPLLCDAAERQAGVVTASQAARAGLSRTAVRSRVRTGRWQRLHQGVYATFSGEPSRASTLWAAVLYAGPGAVLSHQTAAELARLIDVPSDLIHVSIPAQRRVSPAPGLVVHTSARARQAVHPARLPPQTRIEETVLDLADAARTIDDAVGWITRALGRRLTTQARLRDALAERPRIRWRRELTELLRPDLSGLMSVLERRYQRHVERPHNLPAGTRQARVRRGDRTEYRDLEYEEFGTCVELDGLLAHPSESRWRDIRRDNATAADGGVTLRYGWLDLTGRACLTAAEVDRALRRRGFAGGRPCRPGCPVGGESAARTVPPARIRRGAAAQQSRRLTAAPGSFAAVPRRSRDIRLRRASPAATLGR
jgi:Transcriptional regulator, AbiEi antitoxin